MDRLDAMAVFLASVEAGSFSAAARQLGMPLATVSRKISDLEAHLGIQLLIRSTRSLTLTDVGRDYLGACRQILDAVSEAERAAAREYQAPKGALTVTAPTAFGRLVLLPIIVDFLSAYPEVNLRLLLGDRNLNLIDEHVDLALRIGTLPDTTMRATQVGTVRKLVCGSPDYFARQGRPRRPEEAQNHACVSFSALSHPQHWSFGSGRRNVDVPVKSRLEVNSAEAAIDFAQAGLGLTRVLSYQVQSALQDGSLEVVLADYEPAPLPVSLLFLGAEPQPLKLRAFLDFAVPRLRTKLAVASRPERGRQHEVEAGSAPSLERLIALKPRARK